MGTTRTPRSDWIEAGLAAFAAGGPDAVRIEQLAASLGVTKGGFYWQFASRTDLLIEMLDTWERTSVEEVIATLEEDTGDARARLRHLFEMASSEELLRVDLGIRDWARRDAGVAKRLHRVDTQRLEYMRTLFREICDDDDDVEARCLLTFSLFVGSHFVAVDHGSRTRYEVLKLATARLIS